MNSHERILRAINFIPPDKIPIWNTAHFDGFTEKWRRYKNLPETETPEEYYGYDTAVCLGDESFFPGQRKVLKEQSGVIVENDGWGRIIETVRNGYFSRVVGYEYDDRKKLETMKFEPAALSGRFTGLAEEAAGLRKNGRCVFSKTGGIYVRTHRLLPEEELLSAMALEPSFCRDLFSKVALHLTDMALETLKRTGTYETGIWVFDDMAGTYAPMFHPGMFETYLLPLYKMMISRLRAAGCKRFWFHSDGNIGPLLDMLLEAGFSGFNPLEPRSGLDLVKLRKQYGERMVFFGGICNTEILPRGDRAEIKKHLDPLIELAFDGGTILGMASAAGDISPEAYDYCMNLIRKAIR
ncbi:MAG: uroporphyrinogen decarboxylase family protein [Spirochaetia bacterium]